MKEVLLSQNKVALVDDTNYDWLNQWNWYILKTSQKCYVARKSSKKNGKQHHILMHREILGLKRGDKREGDHRNHNTLDNQRHNLRVCTHQENQRNRKPTNNSTSKYKGVCWHKTAKKWLVQININGVVKYLGLHKSEVNAAITYNKAAKKYFGKFAYLNKIY